MYKVISTGKQYYKYYGITVDSEEKLYVASFEEAEEVINKLPLWLLPHLAPNLDVNTPDTGLIKDIPKFTTFSFKSVLTFISPFSLNWKIISWFWNA